MNNVVIMTVKGRLDLTEKCLRSMHQTCEGDISALVLTDAAWDFEQQAVGPKLDEWFPNPQVLRGWTPRTSISEGWNIGIDMWERNRPPSLSRYETAIWLVNNDVEFRKPGWLKLMHDRLEVPQTGMVGAYSMSLFGWAFATGGIWGFRYGVACDIAEEREGFGPRILDEEHFNLSCQDVDLSIRIAKAGYTVTHVPGIELGPDPYAVHSISQTGLTEHSVRDLIKLREPERRALIDKHGRREGSGYEGVVEVA